MRRRIATALAVIGALNGCALFHPLVRPSEVTSQASANTAAARLEALDKILVKKADDYILFDQISGLVLIGAGITAAAFGIFGGSRDGILAAGLAGGTVAGLRAFVPSANRSDIYLQGSEALRCVDGLLLAQDASTDDPNDETLSSRNGDAGSSLRGTVATEQSLGQLSAAVSALNERSLLTERTGLASLTAAAALQGSLLQETAREADEEFQEALDVVRPLNASERLDKAVAAVRSAVNTAIRKSAVDANEALRSALSQISQIPAAARPVFENALRAVERKEEKSEEAAATAQQAAEAAQAAGETDAENDALTLQSLAEQYARGAETQQEFLAAVLRGLDIDSTCAERIE